MLAGLRVQVRGQLAGWVLNAATSDAEGQLIELLSAAIERWAGSTFNRYSNAEVACTARVYANCRDVLRDDQKRWALVHVTYEGSQLTREMLEGTADPAASPRPDLTIRLGHAEVRVEAKRLAPRDQLPQKYVREGMRRFIDGRYSSSHALPGVMLGYLSNMSQAEALDAVNTAISAEADLSATDHLHSQASKPMCSIHRSDHKTPVRLVHLHTVVA